MAKFINRQEEVLQIQMTPYGKSLFSQGKFNPTYYTYYDDDILYDGAYAGLSESQNNIVDRIKTTERLEIYSNFSGSLRNNQTNSNISKNSFDPLTEANSRFFRSIGSNSPWSDFAPAWSINVMDDSVLFSGSLEYRSQESVPLLSASLELEYGSSESTFNYGDEETITITNYFSINQDRLLLDIQELNTIFKLGGNYDIEIFKIPENNSLSMTTLNFIDPNSDSYDLLVSQINSPDVITYLTSDEKLKEIFPVIDSSYVDYFLEVRVDDEISDIPDFRSGLYSAQRPNEAQQPCED